jgi:Transposase zinc-ribbon domain/Transposase
MERVIERCCGLDVHKKTVTACVRLPSANGAREQHVRTFGTTTADLLALRDWLEASGVTHVAMESTGVYWKPVFSVLGISPATARPSFRSGPEPPTGCTQCWGTPASSSPRSQAMSPASRARTMLDALVAGTTDPAVVADLARGRLRKKPPAVHQALVGRFRGHHAFLVAQILAHLDDLDEAIGTLSAHIDTAHRVRKLFADEAACRLYLARSRWPEGVRCPRCKHHEALELPTRLLWRCRACGYDTSVTSGTVLHRTKVPLTQWFWAAYLVATRRADAAHRHDRGAGRHSADPCPSRTPGHPGRPAAVFHDGGRRGAAGTPRRHRLGGAVGPGSRGGLPCRCPAPKWRTPAPFVEAPV